MNELANKPPVLALLIALALVAGCTAAANRLTDEQMVVAASAVSDVLAEQPADRAVAVCFPDRTDAKVRFEPESNASRVSSCPFWRNKILRKSQWELDVARITVGESTSVVEILVTDSNGDHAGRYLFDYERGTDGWRLLRKSFGVA